MPLNLGNSLFESLNDKRGLMICGYEWGFSKKDQELNALGTAHVFDASAVTTFSNKSPAHGERAFSWIYDKKVINWFEFWGHPLSRQGLGGDFEKSIVQTNWCDSEGHFLDEDPHVKLLREENINNFIVHVNELDPALIFFMGSKIIDILQMPVVMDRFKKIFGESSGAPLKMQKEYSGRRFKVGFQSFERCEVICFPHPSSSHGLSNEYISLFKPEISKAIQSFKLSKGISGA